MQNCVLVGFKSPQVSWVIWRTNKTNSFPPDFVPRKKYQNFFLKCEQLFPGVIHAILLLMRAVDPVQYEQDTIEYIDKLTTLDPTRRHYYADLSELMHSIVAWMNLYCSCPANTVSSELAQFNMLLLRWTITFLYQILEAFHLWQMQVSFVVSYD